MSLGRLVGGVSGLPDEAKRRISAIIGAVVADAASLPLEWIYKDETMKEIVGDKNPEFWPESKCPFYTVPTGTLSCYGDELVTSLTTLAASQDIVRVDLAKLQESIQTKFGAADSPYQIALARRADKVYPVPGPWINGGVIASLANMSSGLSPPGSDTCEDNDGLALGLPVYLATGDQASALNTAELLTTCRVAVDHLPVQNQILHNYLTGVSSPVETALATMASSQAEVVAGGRRVVEEVQGGASVAEVVAKFGKACGLPGSFKGSIGGLLHQGKEGDFVSAIRQNILAGGDCNARALLLGSCLGAELGVEGIPMEWIERVLGIEAIIETAVKVFASSE